MYVSYAMLEIRSCPGVNIIKLFTLNESYIQKVKWIRKTEFQGPLRVVAKLRLSLPITLVFLVHLGNCVQIL